MDTLACPSSSASQADDPFGRSQSGVRRPSSDPSREPITRDHHGNLDHSAEGAEDRRRAEQDANPQENREVF